MLANLSRNDERIRNCSMDKRVYSKQTKEVDPSGNCLLKLFDQKRWQKSRGTLTALIAITYLRPYFRIEKIHQNCKDGVFFTFLAPQSPSKILRCCIFNSHLFFWKCDFHRKQFLCFLFFFSTHTWTTPLDQTCPAWLAWNNHSPKRTPQPAIETRQQPSADSLQGLTLNKSTFQSHHHS